jgi:allantoin racemase
MVPAGEDRIKVKDIIGNSNPCVMAEGVRKSREISAGEKVDLVIVGLERGPTGLECAFEEAMAAPHILEQVVLAQEEGYHAVMLDCAGDPVLVAARERVTIPVAAPGEAGMLFAMSLGGRVSIITVSPAVGWMHRNVRLYGFTDRMASIRGVKISLKNLIEARDKTEKMLLEVGRKMMKEDGAEVILLGCTGMSGYASALTEALGIPVLDPAACALKMAVDLVEMGISHSKRSYPFPPSREIKG